MNYLDYISQEVSSCVPYRSPISGRSNIYLKNKIRKLVQISHGLKENSPSILVKAKQIQCIFHPVC